MRNMLLSYDRQLVTARRLARYRRALSAAGDAVTISREAKRHQLIERVAREIIENLLIAGSDNPIVDEIKARLEADTGEKLHFKFPPTEQDLQIFRETKQGHVEVTNQEKVQILNRLWKVTLDKVDETML
jgi:alkanesulfonate monooxygenase SsuD/methylene tetrahydromethanopterin reductase-like flavin-dependent oxidoreductase (luciferase family)